MAKLPCFLLFIATFFFYKFSFANSCRIMVHNSQISPYASEITVVIGTDRKDSKSAIIAAELVRSLTQNKDVRVNLIDLAKLPKSIFKSDYFAKKSAGFNRDFVDPIGRAEGLIFVVPEYDGAVPGILSYYMNHMRLSLNKKQVTLVGVSAGKWGARSALDSFKGTLTHRRARVLGDLQVNLENVDAKFNDNKLTDADSISRLADTAKNIASSTLMNSWGNEASQKIMVHVATARLNSMVNLMMNNTNSVEGKLTKYILNQHGTLAYVQFTGPTKIKNKDVVIPGQDVNVHDQGYGMPVGPVKGFKKGWYNKENLSDAKLEVGKRITLEYESEIIVKGTVKKLTLDGDGNLLVVTFSNVVVNNKKDILFQKEWGDFDIAVADFIEEISVN